MRIDLGVMKDVGVFSIPQKLIAQSQFASKNNGTEALLPWVQGMTELVKEFIDDREAPLTELIEICLNLRAIYFPTSCVFNVLVQHDFFSKCLTSGKSSSSNISSIKDCNIKTS